jgi:hypothetical protein
MANHIGKDTEIQIGDRKYTLSRYTRNIDDEWRAWAKSQAPKRPAFNFAEVKEFIKDLPTEVQQLIVKDTLDQSRQDKAEQEAAEEQAVQQIKASPAGAYKLLELLLRKHHSNLNRAEVEKIYDDMEAQYGYEYLAQKVSECAGVSDQEYQALEKQWLQKGGMLPAAESTFRPFQSLASAR